MKTVWGALLAIGIAAALSTPCRCETLECFSTPVHVLQFSSNGVCLAAASARGEVAVIRMSKGSAHFQLLREAGQLCTALAVAPDNKLLAAGFEDGTIGLWNVSSGNLRTKLGSPGLMVTSVSFSPDGSLIAATSGDTMRFVAFHEQLPRHVRAISVWDLRSFEVRKFLSDEEGVAVSAAFSPSGRVLCASCIDIHQDGRWIGAARIFDVATRIERRRFECQSAFVDYCNMAANEKVVASTTMDGVIEVWEMERGVRTLCFNLGTPPVTGSLSIGNEGTIDVLTRAGHYQHRPGLSSPSLLRRGPSDVTHTDIITGTTDGRRWAIGKMNGTVVLSD